jgi:hypothetical protein
MAKGLGICIESYKSNSNNSFLDHAVHGIAAGATDAKNLDRCLVLEEIVRFHGSHAQKTKETEAFWGLCEGKDG